MERGDYAMWQGRWTDATDDYRAAAEMHPGDWRAQFGYGQCLLKIDEPQSASHVLAIAESLRPTNTAIADLLAEALLRSGNNDRLYSFLHNRAKKYKTVHAWTRMAEYTMELDDPDSATVAINTAIAISNGTDATPYIAAASIAEGLGDDSLAITRWREAWHIDPHNEYIETALRSHGEVPGPTMTGSVDNSE
jgi:cytochrome c-type biogenesis protein CcmH/NrfG